MLYMIKLDHSPQQCPGVSLEGRDRVLRMSETMSDVMQSHGCTFQGGWIGRSSHVAFALVDAPDAHSLDAALVDLGLAVWNTSSMFPVVTLQEATEALRTM